MRNTDRGSDNWMVKEAERTVVSERPSTPLIDVDDSIQLRHRDSLTIGKVEPTVMVAAIDNGLAFPTHHPDRVRSYPYGMFFVSLDQLEMD